MVILHDFGQFSDLTLLDVTAEGDLTVFSSQCRHYETAQQLTKELFTAESRSGAVRRMYEAAAPVPVPVVRQGTGSHFCVTPVLGAAHRKLRVIDIETRLVSSSVLFSKLLSSNCQVFFYGVNHKSQSTKVVKSKVQSPFYGPNYYFCYLQIGFRKTSNP